MFFAIKDDNQALDEPIWSNTLSSINSMLLSVFRKHWFLESFHNLTANHKV